MTERVSLGLMFGTDADRDWLMRALELERDIQMALHSLQALEVRARYDAIVSALGVLYHADLHRRDEDIHEDRCANLRLLEVVGLCIDVNTARLAALGQVVDPGVVQKGDADAVIEGVERWLSDEREGG